MSDPFHPITVVVAKIATLMTRQYELDCTEREQHLSIRQELTLLTALLEEMVRPDCPYTMPPAIEDWCRYQAQQRLRDHIVDQLTRQMQHDIRTKAASIVNSGYDVIDI